MATRRVIEYGTDPNTGERVIVSDTTETVPAEQEAERSITEEAERALTSLRTIANGTGPMTAAQLTVALRGMARVLIVLVRLSLRRFEDVG
jgi:hypothetical protein